jgi:signal transduction histidine kinase
LNLRQLKKTGSIDFQELGKSLFVVDEQATKLTRLVNHLLDLSRLQAGKLILELEQTDIVALVRGIVRNMQLNKSMHDIIIHAPTELVATVDSLRLEQVITNLLNNAVKFSPDGGPIEIDVAQVDAETFSINVTDRGIGIEPHQRENLFNRFYQAHAGTLFGGMGLGLYISRQIVELHNGTIWAEFPDDGGTRIVIRLPCNPTPNDKS